LKQVGSIIDEYPYRRTQITQKQQQDFRRLIRPCWRSGLWGDLRRFFENNKLDLANGWVSSMAGSIGENPVAVSA